LSHLHALADAAHRTYLQAKRRRDGLDADRQQADDALKPLESALPGATAQKDGASTSLDDWTKRVADVRAALSDATRQLLGNVTTDLPLLLLPVRLETRFEYGPDGTKPQALKVRIYPDDIHINSHEADLTADEVVWGRSFWSMHERAGSLSERMAAWRLLVSRFGVNRAAWITRVLAPAAGR